MYKQPAAEPPRNLILIKTPLPRLCFRRTEPDTPDGRALEKLYFNKLALRNVLHAKLAYDCSKPLCLHNGLTVLYSYVLALLF